MELKNITGKNIPSTQVHPTIKQRITEAQADTLKYNQFNLNEGDKLTEKYDGAGLGWLEINKDGELVNLGYGFPDSKNDENDPARFISINFNKRALVPFIQTNGNIKILVNISCYTLTRFN